MKMLIHVIAVVLLSSLLGGRILAQDVTPCTETDQAALKTCLTLAEAACLAQVPQCQKQPISLEELNQAIDEKCGDCSENSAQLPRNYGKYRSCVMSVVNTLKAFSLIDVATKQTILAENKACRALIQEKKKGNRGKNPKN